MNFGERLVNGRRRQVIVIDRSPSWAESLARLLRVELGIEAGWCTLADVADDDLDRADVVVLDGSGGHEEVARVMKIARAQSPDGRVLLLSAADAVRRVVDERDVDEVMGRGATATEFLSAVRCLLDDAPLNPRPAERRLDRGRAGAQLTAAEARVLQHLAAGCSNEEIAAGLGVSTNTVRTHVQRITRKLGVDSRLRAVALARETGMLDGIAVSVVGR